MIDWDDEELEEVSEYTWEDNLVDEYCDLVRALESARERGCKEEEERVLGMLRTQFGWKDRPAKWMTTARARRKLKDMKPRSAWQKGVRVYALELLDMLEDNMEGKEVANRDIERELLCGARDWKQYSWGGLAFVYDGDIAEALCTPSELKRVKGGELPPSREESWLDVQARALEQASWLVKEMFGGKNAFVRKEEAYEDYL